MPLPLPALWIACAADPSGVRQDIERYTSVTGDTTLPPEQGFATCAAITDEDLAGDCALVVATRAATGSRESPTTWCARVPEGTWRSECLFEGSEMMLRRNNPEAAVSLCLKAGPFRDDCAMHLWQSSLDRVTWGMTTATFAERLPAARQIYDSWSMWLSETDLEGRFWSRFYQVGFGGRAGVDLSVCDALASEDALRCQRVGAEVFASRLGPYLQMSGQLAAFCARPLGSAVVAPWVGARPHAALDAALAERWPQLCEDR